jgi:hypothetical protein
VGGWEFRIYLLIRYERRGRERGEAKGASREKQSAMKKGCRLKIMKGFVAEKRSPGGSVFVRTPRMTEAQADGL